MAALDRIAFAVAVGSFLDLRHVDEMLAKALAQRRAEVAAQIHIRGVHAHSGKDFFQCIYDAGSGIDQGPVHIKQNRIVVQQCSFPHFHGDTLYSIAQNAAISNSNKWIL